jgi:hypothetical protein
MLKRLASSRAGLCVIAALLLLVGFGAGFRIRDQMAGESLHSLVLAHSTLELVRATTLVRALRDGLVDPARERLETQLDQAIIDMSYHYTPARDSDGRAARAIREARAYREAYPEHFQRSALRSLAEPALARLPK